MLVSTIILFAPAYFAQTYAALVSCGEFKPGYACDPAGSDKLILLTTPSADCRAKCEAQGGDGCCYFRPPPALPHECEWNAGGKLAHAGVPAIRSAAACTGGPPPPPPPPAAHEQLHIAFGDTDDVLVVTWASLCYPCRQAALLHWSLAGSSAPRKIANATTTQGGSSSPRVSIHRVVLAGLQAGERYNFTLAWDAAPFMETAPRLLEPKRPGANPSVRLAMFGDIGYTNDQVTRFLRDESAARTIDAIVCYGDMVYWWREAAAAGEPGTGDIFFRAVENMSAGIIPFHVSPGNGDAGGNFSEYRHRWFMPAWEQTESLWHSFDLGRMHMVGISTEAMGYYTNSEGGSWDAMLAWLKADLAAATTAEARALRPWIVVHQHRPSYSTDGAELFGTQRENYLALEDLFYESGVDMVFAGHVHNMERTWPVYSNRSTPTVKNGTKVPGDPYANAEAPVYIVSGPSRHFSCSKVHTLSMCLQTCHITGAVGNAEEHKIAHEAQVVRARYSAAVVLVDEDKYVPQCEENSDKVHHVKAQVAKSSFFVACHSKVIDLELSFWVHKLGSVLAFCYGLGC